MQDSNEAARAAPEPAASSDGEHGAVDAPLGTAAVQRAETDGRPVVVFSLSNWAVARYALIALLVLGGIYLLWKIQEVLLLLLLAILFATAIEPVVDRLRQGPFSRGQGILIVYSLIFGLIAAVTFFFVPGIVEQLTRFIETLPERISSLRPLIEQIGLRPLRELLLRGVGAAQPAVQRTLEQPVASAEPEQIVAAGGALAHTLFSVVTVFLLAYYWLTERSTIKRAMLRLAPPSRVRQINAVWLQVEEKLGGWVRGQLLIMLALGLMSGGAFLVLGLPNPLILAILAGLCEIVPLVGPFLAFIPALLVALSVDPVKALILIPIAVVIQQIEGNILIPRVMSKTTGISQLTVILGILIGSILYGAAGAFLAVPIAAAIQVILNEVLQPALEEETDKVPVPNSELEGERRPTPGAVSPTAPRRARARTA